MRSEHTSNGRPEEQAALLRRLVGADVAELWLEQSQTEANDATPALMSVWIVLRGGDGVRISAAPGGAGVRISDEPPAPVDMGEWGQISVTQAAGRLALQPGRIIDVWGLDVPRIATGDRLAGVRWSQADGSDIAVFQDDDCLLVGPFEEVAQDPGVAQHQMSLVPVGGLR